MQAQTGKAWGYSHAEPPPRGFQDQAYLRKTTESIAIHWLDVLEGKGVRKMMKKLSVLFLTAALVAAFSLPALGQDTIAGKIQALDRVGKRITLAGAEYTLSDEAAQTTFKVGDPVEATVEGSVVKKLARLLQ
jgi:hypothetical protein